ncbi:MAG: histone deacetylase family protein [Bacteriovoracia bacterium]
MSVQIPVLYHPSQKDHKPLYEWAFGEKLDHPETTRRIESILAAIDLSPSDFSMRKPDPIVSDLIRRVHDERLSKLYETAEEVLKDGTTFHPSVFPQHQLFGGRQPDPTQLSNAGAFCFDSGTPLTSLTKMAAEWSAACAQSASMLLENKETPFAYALCRPPGHHASQNFFGGYCYYNNAAIVVARLREKARVAIVDIDFHHGNGTQEIFYDDNRVLFISIHGDPAGFYPYFSGFKEETGKGDGKGFTINIPLPSGVDGKTYLQVLERDVVPAVQRFTPDYLVLSAGFDTYKEDPIGKFTLETNDYAEISARFAHLGLPTLIVQEGGYSSHLGQNVVTFLKGFRDNYKR